jgi:secreted PhoX family phosphatase
MQSTRYTCQILLRLEFCRQIFEKYSNTKLHENPSSGSRVVPRGRVYIQTDKQTDRHDEANVSVRNFANASKNGTAGVSANVQTGRLPNASPER